MFARLLGTHYKINNWAPTISPTIMKLKITQKKNALCRHAYPGLWWSPWPCIWACLCCALDEGRRETPPRPEAGRLGGYRPGTSDPSDFPISPGLQKYNKPTLFHHTKQTFIVEIYLFAWKFLFEYTFSLVIPYSIIAHLIITMHLLMLVIFSLTLLIHFELLIIFYLLSHFLFIEAFAGQKLYPVLIPRHMSWERNNPLG